MLEIGIWRTAGDAQRPGATAVASDFVRVVSASTGYVCLY